ncbi:Acylamino-acid-releasing enzyme [Roseomonas mucosa]|uniref:Acyl-peptide hydrolase n=1 Tax=Roseomonas mucosa TaxID=207340 RepID=A0A4Y1MUA9_9PROT|nr:S9 family peptidase [Roseomonas mucosa]AWV21605.1 Acylamino-acid-releasing enzyme [Roseomonas mucosa]MDT8277961.1 S9 family peptidase [Roseomonas mucosa]
MTALQPGGASQGGAPVLQMAAMTDLTRRIDRLLAAPAATAPSFAADGRLYFLNDADGSAQVWEIPADGGEARPRSAHRDPVAFVAGSPADGGAVFGRDTAGDERVQLYALPPEGEARALTANPRAIHGWGAFSPDGTRIACTANSRDPAHTDPVVIDLASGEAWRAHEVEGPHELRGWTPDGQALVLAVAPRTFEDSLLRVPLDGGTVEALAPHEGDWRHLFPRWKRDGSGFWLVTDRGRDFLGAAFMAPGGEPRFLYAPEADLEAMEVSPDQSILAVVVNEGGWSRLRLVDAATGAVLEEPAHPRGVITKISWRKDGRAVGFDLARPTAPGTIWLAERGSAARMIFAASPAPEGMRDWETVSFPTFDGREVPAYLALPAGTPPAGGWPVLLWVHGGPAGQARPNWRPDLQTVLSLGIAVVVPNVRGSTGYGRAYAALDDRELRLDSVRDLAAAHGWIGGQPGLDGSRIAIMGQSYGGWMVLAAVTEYPELWAAGVDYYGIANWKTFFERTGPWRVGHRAAEYGDPVKDAALLERLSPLHRADRIACPMLVAQGLTDPRVPPYESEQIVAALKARDVPVEYVVFPDEGHGFLKRDNKRRIYGAVAHFLREHLRA